MGLIKILQALQNIVGSVMEARKDEKKLDFLEALKYMDRILIKQ